MSFETQRNYFETAYRTGSDIWSHIPYYKPALAMLPPLPHDAMILDIGAGRGLWLRKLLELGYRVLGVDYIQSIVDRVNADIKQHGISDRARFVYGDVRDIPFADHSFDLVTDIGLLQHLDPADWQQYANELNRVLKPGGYIFSVLLAKESIRFLDVSPKHMPGSQIEKFGVSYYFFTPEELEQIYGSIGCTLVHQKTEQFGTRNDPADNITFLFSLYRKDN